MQQASAVVRELKPRLLIYRRNRATRIGSPLHEKLVARQPNYAGQIKHVYAALHVGAVQVRLLAPGVRRCLWGAEHQGRAGWAW